MTAPARIYWPVMDPRDLAKVEEGPAALARAGLEHWRAGRMDQAVATLNEACRRAPGDVSVWTKFAECLAAANRPDLAHPAWSRALALDAKSAGALCGRARAAQALARPAEAKADFEAALAVEPTLADAHFGLAELALESGDLDAVAARLASVEAAGGGVPAAAWLGARLAFARGDFPEVERRLAPLADDARLPEPARADALLLRARALDRLGETGRAFRSASEGKAIQRRLFAPRAAGREGEIEKLARLAAWFEAADSAPWRVAPAPGDSPAAGHAFLLGFPRSGTTLLEQSLAAHPQVCALEEAPTLADAAQALLNGGEGPAALLHLSGEDLAIWRARYWRVVREHGASPDGKLFLDKAPAGTAYPPLIARLFPQARLLFAVRDPRDVTLSCLMSPFQMNALTYTFTNLDQTAHCYDAAMRLAGVLRPVLPLAVRDVRYERLVENFEAELRGICDFLGLEFEPSMADVAASAGGRAVRTPSATQVREGLNRRGLARWRAYGAELAPVMPILAPWIEALGYGAGGSG